MEEAIRVHGLTAERILNMDETSFASRHKSKDVVALKELMHEIDQTKKERDAAAKKTKEMRAIRAKKKKKNEITSIGADEQGLDDVDGDENNVGDDNEDAELAEFVCLEEWFHDNLRCDQTVIRRLVNLLHQRLQPNERQSSHSFEKKVSVTLYFLGSEGDYRETAAAFGMAKSWCITVVATVVDVLASQAKLWIRLSTYSGDWSRIERGFYKHSNGGRVCVRVPQGEIPDFENRDERKIIGPDGRHHYMLLRTAQHVYPL
ncbi:hypothetical protein H257_16691 [Aphanomyces astaci]|uniref:DDE Tnp4 domain-containing protein n=1 Tax=Aphanomyces astaci TaxID=112090 RepID=W4FHR1_APHAT|nr:hypothetical protein H257_16691 [Aphanomyces astaci]ETV67000.1 hypothetical protein H257_16691 [Aphanomyces astaci]|eukprot:XP_009843517.1 hypothetical protein H257_16691 [Aphanomyces astaci]